MRVETRSPYLELEVLGSLAHMRFTPRRRIDGAYSGRHRSRQQGGAGEFVDFREYSGGEDLRRLDWKVLARTGKAFVRLHQDETNLLCTLAIDASGSMQFGEGRGTKLDYVKHLATALSHIISQSQDQVGVGVMGNELGEYLPPGGAATHIALLQEIIANAETKPSTTMSEGLRQMFERSRRRGVLMLLSDFLMDDLEEVFAAVRLFRHSGWEVIAMHVVHPDEESLPDGTAFRFVGMEGEGETACSPAEIRTEYRRRFQAHTAMIRQMALAGGCDHRLVSTAVPYIDVLQSFLVERTG